jgi:hypothetical protein
MQQGMSSRSEVDETKSIVLLNVRISEYRQQSTKARIERFKERLA